MSELFAKLVARLPAPLRALAERARAMPKNARILVTVTLIVAVPLVGFAVSRGRAATYAVLFASMDREDAAAVVAKLKERKIDYRLEGDGTTVLVPEPEARELRLELAADGLPRGGGVGFEAFDKNRFGATEFEQRVLFRRALEGELARTIQTINAIESARVHLVLPERSVFVHRGEAASASIVVKLRGGRAVGSTEVQSIVHLVSSSVPGLAGERVALVTTQGAVLHRPKKAGEESTLGMADEHLATARALEATLEDRARAMLEKVVGPGHADVRVTVELEAARVEHTEEHFDPKQTALRSEERSSERAQGEITPAAVPGAESNLPGVQPKPAGGQAADAVVRESRTQNFEVDRVSEKRVTPGGAVRRLTVAAVLDGGAGGKFVGLDAARMSALVKSAVGADERRGDVVTVDLMPFTGEAAEAAAVVAPTPSLTSRLPSDRVQAVGLVSAAALTLLVAALIRRRRRRSESSELADKAVAASAEEQSASPDPEEVTAAPAEESVEELRHAAQSKALSDPATAALVIRYWLGTARDKRAGGDADARPRASLERAA
jgi:flagellar M-ring protein FliF